MVEIVPAVLAETPSEYQRDLDKALSVSSRVQIDLTDGDFADNKTIGLVQAHWPDDIKADLHLMYQNPKLHTETLISMSPHLVIAHSEARGLESGDIERMCDQLQEVGIKFGLAVLPQTTIKSIERFLPDIDHVLVFTGELGHYGGEMQLDCLQKIQECKNFNENLEVGVDGGVTDTTIEDAVRAGADILNVGGFIQKASDPQLAYDKLKQVVKNPI